MEDAPWPMEEDIISGSALFTETYQVASTLTLSSALRSTVEYGNKSIHFTLPFITFNLSSSLFVF